jgi:hypothetical protein
MPAALPTRIRKLYKNGWSEEAIASEFHTQIGTVMRLLNKSKFSNKSIGYIKSCERKRKRLMNLDSVKIAKINRSKARLYAAILYWCEGSKYPASTALNFTTTDLQMQKLFLALFRKGFNPTESKFRIWLQFHSGQNKQNLFKYWSTNLRIPVSQFMKPSITDKKGGRYRKVYRGTCSLRYADYSMILRLMGIYQRFYKQAFSSLI